MTGESARSVLADAEVLARALEVGRRLEIEECLLALARGVCELSGAETVLCYGYSDSGFDLELIAGTLDEDAPLREPLGLLDARVLDDEIPVEGRFFEDPGPFAPVSGWGPDEPRSLLALPLLVSGDRVGLVLVLDPPEEEGRGRAAALVGECGQAVSNALTVRDLKDLMIRDDTADCHNRRYFDEYLTGEVARAVRFGGRLSVIFLDMDNLKDVNTRHGHTAGSQVLYEASVRINRSIRTVDKLFRFGGDEFCIVLPETGPAGAREVAERVRRALAESPFVAEISEGEWLTASFGVSSFPDHGRSAGELVESADRAMRRIKDSRKNAIALAGENGPERSEP